MRLATFDCVGPENAGAGFAVHRRGEKLMLFRISVIRMGLPVRMSVGYNENLYFDFHACVHGSRDHVPLAGIHYLYDGTSTRATVKVQHYIRRVCAGARC